MMQVLEDYMADLTDLSRGFTNDFELRAAALRLFELKLLNSSCSSSNFSIRVFRAYPLVETIQISVEQFEATVSQSTVPSLPLRLWNSEHPRVVRGREVDR